MVVPAAAPAVVLAAVAVAVASAVADDAVPGPDPAIAGAVAHLAAAQVVEQGEALRGTAILAVGDGGALVVSARCLGLGLPFPRCF